jgi:hypothetical protein
VHQIIQTNHATRAVTAACPQGEGIPNIVLVGVADVTELLSVQSDLVLHQVPSYPFVEPDNDLGFTAIATIAIDRKAYPFLRKYRPYARGTGQPVCEGNLDARTKAGVAQMESHQ